MRQISCLSVIKNVVKKVKSKNGKREDCVKRIEIKGVREKVWIKYYNYLYINHDTKE